MRGPTLLDCRIFWLFGPVSTTNWGKSRSQGHLHLRLRRGRFNKDAGAGSGAGADGGGVAAWADAYHGRSAMRVLLSAFLALLASSPLAQTIDDGSAADIDAGTVSAIMALATRDLGEPDAAHLRRLHKSLARNGKGYCGEVSRVAGGDFTVFHAILENGTGPSVLRLADYPEEDRSPSAVAVRRLMRNFGCIE
jgi:hypothetical protein